MTVGAKEVALHETRDQVLKDPSEPETVLS